MEHNDRLNYLKKHIDYKSILEHYKYYDYDAFVVNQYGDINTYRVYGNKAKGFQLSEK